MILILSSEQFETTTEEVIDWLDSFGAEWVRINSEDLLSQEPLEIVFNDTNSSDRLCLGGVKVRCADVNTIWLRRWRQVYEFDVHAPEELISKVNRHLWRETRALGEALQGLFEHAEWLTSLGEARLPKMRLLQLAAQAGLLVPPTAIINSRESLQIFKNRWGSVITKCIADVDAFVYGGRNWGMYTIELTQDRIECAPDTFFPTLVQRRLEKKFEVRVFYLDGVFYPMAIFSQASEGTRDDFRCYDWSCPNRTVPHKLPEEVVKALGRFVESAGITTGSLDLVCTPSGQYFFLEVNPGGQFGMVSKPCNYRLEKLVADFLLRRDRGRVSGKATGEGSCSVTAPRNQEVGRNPDFLSDVTQEESLEVNSPFEMAPASANYPLIYRWMQPMSDSARIRSASSSFHRSSSYACFGYYKPVSLFADFGSKEGS